MVQRAAGQVLFYNNTQKLKTGCLLQSVSIDNQGPSYFMVISTPRKQPVSPTTVVITCKFNNSIIGVSGNAGTSVKNKGRGDRKSIIQRQIKHIMMEGGREGERERERKAKVERERKEGWKERKKERREKGRKDRKKER
ncbi:Chromatin assembly factor 1 subunit A, partial [Ophiophagus hannah]